MFYDFSFTILADTSASSPKVERVKLEYGILHLIEISFPAGCAGLVHLQIFDNGHQLFPTNPGGSFNTDDYTIRFNDHYPLLNPPYTLRLVGWNLDDTYDHTLEIRLGILPPEILFPYKEEMGLIGRIKKWIGLE